MDLFKKKKLKIFISIFVVIIIVGFLSNKLLFSNIQNKDNTKNNLQVTTFEVEKGNIEENIELTAALEGTESVDIVSKLHYKVTDIYVKEGDRVQKEQVIAQLDTEAIEKDIKELEDNIELLKIQLKESKNGTDNSYSLAKSQLDESIKSKQVEYEKTLNTLEEEKRKLDNLKLTSDKNLEEEKRKLDSLILTSSNTLEEEKRKLDNLKVLFEGGVETQENFKKAQFDYDKLKLETEENISQAQANYDKLKLEVEESINQAQTNYENISNLLNTYNVVNGRVVATKSEIQNLENIREGNNIESMKKNIEIAEKNLERKKSDLLECQIKSSIDGTITRVNTNIGRFADDTETQKPMFVIENIDNLQMKGNISEYDISKIKEGQKVTISASILGDKTIEGIVSRISPTGEQKSANGTERVIPIIITVLEKDENLIAGINAKAKIHINQNQNTLFVPIECVYTDENKKSSVYKVNSENKIEIIPVELGVENDLSIEIKGNINEGDLVIMSPEPSTMTQGSVVMPI